MTGDYLAMLDALLASGRPYLGAATVEGARSVARNAQSQTGAFRGRSGNDDLYYTDFGTRLLWLLDPQDPGLAHAAAYVNGIRTAPATMVDRFCLLNAARNTGAIVMCHADIAKALASEALPSGAFARTGAHEVSAYATFLASLSLQILGEGPLPPTAISAVRDLRRHSGGFAEMTSQSQAQTNSTAAALGVLVPAHAIDESAVDAASAFLVGMQEPDGGLRAHQAARTSDLLSTFTGLLALLTSSPAPGIDLAAVARFVRGCAKGGGFTSAPGDLEPDVEYTWYGLACLCLLYAHVEVATAR